MVLFGLPIALPVDVCRLTVWSSVSLTSICVAGLAVPALLGCASQCGSLFAIRATLPMHVNLISCSVPNCEKADALPALYCRWVDLNREKAKCIDPNANAYDVLLGAFWVLSLSPVISVSVLPTLSIWAMATLSALHSYSGCEPIGCF